WLRKNECFRGWECLSIFGVTLLHYKNGIQLTAYQVYSREVIYLFNKFGCLSCLFCLENLQPPVHKMYLDLLVTGSSPVQRKIQILNLAGHLFCFRVLVDWRN